MSAPQQSGRPLWVDLTSHDVDGASAFYADLFGWEYDDQGPDWGHYTIVTKDGARVGGLMTSLMGPEGPTTEPTGPTAWNVYLHTADIAAALAAIPQLGGQIVYGPMDIGDQGRQAFVIDPTGAALGLWEPKDLPGFEMPLTPGTPVWFEVMTSDLDKALPFYRDVLGWDIHWMGGTSEPSAGLRYATNGEGEASVAGLCDASTFLPAGGPSFWRAYFGVEDADATAARIMQLGGAVQETPQDSPFGRFAQVADPQGAVFMIIETTP